MTYNLLTIASFRIGVPSILFNLRDLDNDQEKLDRYHALQRKYDDPWETPNPNQFARWKTLIDEYQEDLINSDLLTKPKIMPWIEYVVDESNPSNSKIR